MNVSKAMTLTALFALEMLVGAVAPALAAPVSYSTTGGFDGATPAPTAFFNGTTNSALPPQTAYLEFQGVSESGNTTISLPLADFIVYLPSGTSISATPTSSFALVIAQSTPPGSTTLSPEVLTGSITTDPKLGSIDINFSANTSFVVNGVSYQLEGLGNNGAPAGTLGISYNASSSIPQVLSAELVATSAYGDNPTPEPTFYGLLGIGIASMVTVVIRRKRQEV